MDSFFGEFASDAPSGERTSGVFSERRARLALGIGAAPALLHAGRAPSRNYTANVYPFRASSHFLYFIGAALEGAYALIEQGGCTLFLPERSPEEIVWNGPPLCHQELQARLGVTVRSISELSRRVPRSASVVPFADAVTRRELNELLQRDTSVSLECDRLLAEAIIAVRLIQDPSAERELRKAAAVTVLGHCAGMKLTSTGSSEVSIRAAIENTFFAHGAGIAYQSIITTHGEVLHETSSQRRLHSGELLLADAGAETNAGWAADVTRTWPVNGTFSPSQRAAYEVVLNAQESALAMIRPGARYLDVHLEACRALVAGLLELGILKGRLEELLEKQAFVLFFPHGIGHLLGLDAHDMEDLGDRAGYAPGRSRSGRPGLRNLRLDRDLAAGMALTVEPGLYFIPSLLASSEWQDVVRRHVCSEALERFRDVRGIRIEDDVVVTSDGCEVLTCGLARRPEDVQMLVGAGRI